MSRTFYVNGEFVAEADAKISVLDRGFLFADAVYEVTTVLDGRLIDNRAHLARLRRSRSELFLAAPCSDDDIVAAQQELVARNDVREGLVYLQVSRGVADRDFAFPKSSTSSLVMFTQTKAMIDSASARDGIRVISVPDLRWKRRDIKTVGLLAPSMAKQAAVDAGVQDAWMVEGGLVTEGSSNNAYIVRADRVIQTRQLGHEILSGITRAAVLRFAGEQNYTIEEAPFTIEQAQQASEAFVTSASTFVTAVVEIDGVSLGSGKPGPVASELRRIYIETALQHDELSDARH